MNLVDTLPRLVLPDNTVIMPGDIGRIELEEEETGLEIKEIEFTSGGEYDYCQSLYDKRLNKARHDRCTLLPDKNGKMIYENDRVQQKWGNVVFEGIVKQDHTGRWIVRTRAMDFVLSDQCEYWEAPGHVPYGEEK